MTVSVITPVKESLKIVIPVYNYVDATWYTALYSYLTLWVLSTAVCLHWLKSLITGCIILHYTVLTWSFLSLVLLFSFHQKIPDELPVIEKKQVYGLATPEDFTLPPHHPLWTTETYTAFEVSAEASEKYDTKVSRCTSSCWMDCSDYFRNMVEGELLREMRVQYSGTSE